MSLFGLDDWDFPRGVPRYKLKHPWQKYDDMFGLAHEHQQQAQVADFKMWLEEHYPDSADTDPYEFMGAGQFVQDEDFDEDESGEGGYTDYNTDRRGDWLKDARKRRPELFDPALGFPGAQADAEYFASGSNHAGEIRALALLGIHVGVAVSDLDKSGKAFDQLVKLRGLPIKIFVDSGAFGEVDFKASPPCSDARFPPPCVKVSKAGKSRFIDDAEWHRRLAIYTGLARELGPQLYLVAPDMVGHQIPTLQRTVQYRDTVRELAALGANIILPVQKGPNGTMSAMYRTMVQLLGDDVIPAWEAAQATYWKRWGLEGQEQALREEFLALWERKYADELTFFKRAQEEWAKTHHTGEPPLFPDYDDVDWRGFDEWLEANQPSSRRGADYYVHWPEYKARRQALHSRARGGQPWARSTWFEQPEDHAPSTPWIAGVPSKKGASTLAEILELVDGVLPDRMHLLGLGRFNDRYTETVAAIRARCRQHDHEMGLTCDSVRLKALVGRGEVDEDSLGDDDADVEKAVKKGGKARPITAMRDALIAAGRDGSRQNSARLKYETVARVFLNEQLQRLDDAVDAGWTGPDYVYYDSEFF